MKLLFQLNSYPLVAIVILNWNGRRFLQQFLPSVLASSYPNFKIIVADNASTDDSIALLKQHFPNVHVLQLSQNFGFAKGYNEALKQIQAPYYLLLNSDVEVTHHWLHPLVTLLESNENYAACQPKICASKNKKLFEYAGAAGGWIDQFGYPFARGRIFDICETDIGQYDTCEKVFWASGAAMLIKSKLYHEAGGFDPFFFAHQEEIDLCWRLQLKGYHIWCCPQSVVYHVGGGTLPRGNSRKTYLNFRNNLVMLAKNLTVNEAAWKLLIRIILDLLSAFKGLVTGDPGYFTAVLKAHASFYKWLFLQPKNRSGAEKKMANLTGVYTHSIVWQHFVKKKNRFVEIVKRG